MPVRPQVCAARHTPARQLMEQLRFAAGITAAVEAGSSRFRGAAAAALPACTRAPAHMASSCVGLDAQPPPMVLQPAAMPSVCFSVHGVPLERGGAPQAVSHASVSQAAAAGGRVPEPELLPLPLLLLLLEEEESSSASGGCALSAVAARSGLTCTHCPHCRPACVRMVPCCCMYEAAYASPALTAPHSGGLAAFSSRNGISTHGSAWQ